MYVVHIIKHDMIYVELYVGFLNFDTPLCDEVICKKTSLQVCETGTIAKF